MNYKIGSAILVLLLSIFLFPFLQKYEMFCPCGTVIKEEPFCGSSCAENFSLSRNDNLNNMNYMNYLNKKNNYNTNEHFCGGKSSSKSYALNNIYAQTCGYKTPTTTDYCNGYYIPTMN